MASQTDFNFGYGFYTIQAVISNLTEYTERLSRVDREQVIVRLDEKSNGGTEDAHLYRSLMYHLAAQVNQEYKAKQKSPLLTP